MNPDKIKYIFERACLRKANLTEAIADSIVTKALKEGLLLYWYKCECCGSHHLTKQIPTGLHHKFFEKEVKNG